MTDSTTEPSSPPEKLRLTPEDAAIEITKRAISVAATQQRRVVVGIAGGPGSGKSTIAAAVIGQLNDLIDGSAARVPMDGFHMKHDKLVEMELDAVKGSPETFDPRAFISFLKNLKQSRQPCQVPSYSRKIEDVVENAFTIAGNVPILVVEGNYLLLSKTPWHEIRDLLDVAIYISVPRDKVRARLLKRHREHDLFTEERNIAHVDNVDLANYDLVASSRDRADVVIDLLTES